MSNLREKIDAKEDAITETKHEIKALKKEVKTTKDSKATKWVLLSAMNIVLGSILIYAAVDQPVYFVGAFATFLVHCPTLGLRLDTCTGWCGLLINLHRNNLSELGIN